MGSVVPKQGLYLDWCSYEAAKYAVEHWHYSGSMPVGKTVKIGVWEDGDFIGVVIFSRGATPYIGRPYGLAQTQVCELARVALREHKAPVSRIVAVALRLLKKHNPGIRLVVSFADISRGHRGAIYQAGNWVYAGKCDNAGKHSFLIKGRVVHPRTLGSAGVPQNLTGARLLDPNAQELGIGAKHRYLMPLDDAMRRQIEPLRQPYPKREADRACAQ